MYINMIYGTTVEEGAAIYEDFYYQGGHAGPS
jgi:hypothetical protein